MKLFGSTIKETVEVLFPSSKKEYDWETVYPELAERPIASKKQAIPPQKLDKVVEETSGEEPILPPPSPVPVAKAATASHDRMIIIMRFSITVSVIGFSIYLYLHPELDGKGLANTMIGAVAGYWLK
ncbi:hypothetical protein R9C00_27635 [Flammeovirgaceae bacterium SG7u.111]|nr:hypothetical protein [Flammeovirgaceae bacterium SG7u.132]WPO35473.1 hypothetical protein R9C00_27635 [Flammeovirgaceae bacterium SG7u.111]